jgi:site-specific recombinase XerD
MTRSGFAYVLRKHVRVAMATCPSLVGRSVSPHVLRHTCALDTLRATGDLRKVSLWLGHAQQSTTEIYLQVDPTDKIEMLESVIQDYAESRTSGRAPTRRTPGCTRLGELSSA